MSSLVFNVLPWSATCFSFVWNVRRKRLLQWYSMKPSFAQNMQRRETQSAHFSQPCSHFQQSANIFHWKCVNKSEKASYTLLWLTRFPTHTLCCEWVGKWPKHEEESDACLAVYLYKEPNEVTHVQLLSLSCYTVHVDTGIQRNYKKSRSGILYSIIPIKSQSPSSSQWPHITNPYLPGHTQPAFVYTAKKQLHKHLSVRTTAFLT